MSLKKGKKKKSKKRKKKVESSTEAEFDEQNNIDIPNTMEDPPNHEAHPSFSPDE